MVLVLSLFLAVASSDTTQPGECSAELQNQLKSEGVELASRRVDPFVEGEVKRTLVIRQGEEVVLRRELGTGTCAQIARAAVVVLKRWLTSLGQIQLVPRTQQQEARGPTAPEPIASPTPRKPFVPKEPTPRPTAAEGPIEVETRTEEDSPLSTPPQVNRPSVAKEPAAAERPSNEPLPEAGTPQAPTAELPRETTPPPPTQTEVVASRPRPLRIEVTHWEVLAGGGLVTPATFGALTPLASLDFSLILNERIRILLWGGFDFGSSNPIIDEDGNTRGTMSYLGAYVLPGAMICTQGVLRGCGGFNIGTKIVRADASGAFIFQTRAAVSGEFVVAPALQLASFLGPFEWALDGSFMITPVPAAFSFDGLVATVASPRIQGLFRLSVGYGPK